MQSRPTHLIRSVIVCAIALSVTGLSAAQADNTVRSTSSRYTPLVRAVENCRLSVVNLRGRKTVPSENHSDEKLKQVNGMGTGVVIDSRGYILTNFHVVQGVKVIEVSTAEREKTTARLLAHDPATDLAILKIETKKPLPTIKLGSSSDLMLAEQVTAVGNAYGYEHTVTLGIISALKRTVQVNDEQIYRNLIQTDAAINPGNSGGPLLNVNGEMIGINVAVRIGAQGIAFAIPVNDAIEVAAELMSEVVPDNVFHGMRTRTVYIDSQPRLIVESVDKDGPAAKAGLQRGSQIVAIEGRDAVCDLDLQTSLVGLRKDTLSLQVLESNQRRDVKIKLADSSSVVRRKGETTASSLAWLPLGIKVVPATDTEMKDRHPNYKRGLRIVSVRGDSPAEREGMMNGDILVAMHGWKTESLENLAYILQRDDVAKRENFMFYILRDKEPFWGQMRVASLPSRME